MRRVSEEKSEDEQRVGEEEELQLNCSSFFIPGSLSELGEHATPTRRRVRKTRDSAVVLSFEAMRRCLEASPPTLTAFDTQPPTVEVPTQAYSKSNGLQEGAVRHLQRVWRVLRKAKRESRVAVIQRWYRRRSLLEKRIRMLRLTQNNLWTLRQSDLVWSIILGHRVRVLLRSEACRAAVTSIYDTCDVLYDVLVVPSEDRSLLSVQSRAKRIKAALDCVACMRISGKGHVLKERGLTSRDGDLASSLIRQLSNNKARLRDLVFRLSRWRLQPAPGYLDLRKSLHINRALVAAVPPKTPPRALAGRGSDNRVAPNGVAIGGASAVSSPPPPPSAAAAAATTTTTTTTTAAPCASSSAVTVTPPCPASRGPHRASPRAHIQLEVLCADRLSAARRRRAGSSPDDGDKPDRKPGLRVTLLLPPQPTAAPGPLTAVKKLSRDFSDTTLSPRWDCTLQVPLPVPKSLAPPADVLVGSSDGQQQLDAKACVALMDWWAGGILRVEVIDGERFNSDIFLGQQELFLSQFLLSPSICGTFPLSKQTSTDRVAGTITLNAYLHLPEVSSLVEAPQRPASRGAEANETREPLQPPHPAFRIARSVLTQSRNRTPPSLSVLRSCSPVKTDAAAVTVNVTTSLEPSSPPPPPPPPPTSSRPVTAGEHERRRQITDCLTGLEAQLASLDALSGLINTKFQTKGAGGGVGRTSL